MIVNRTKGLAVDQALKKSCPRRMKRSCGQHDFWCLELVPAAGEGRWRVRDQRRHSVGQWVECKSSSLYGDAMHECGSFLFSGEA